jgi:uncharacterized protein YaeQ
VEADEQPPRSRKKSEGDECAVGTKSGAGKLAQRSMQLQCTIQDGQIWMSAGDASVQIDLELLKDFG